MNDRSLKSEFAEYIQVLSLIRWRGSRLTTSKDIQDKFGWRAQSAQLFLGNLRSVGLIGIKHSTPSAESGPCSQVHHYGMGEDAPEYAGRRRIRQRTNRAQRFADFINLLRLGTYSINDLVAATGMRYAHARNAIAFGSRPGQRIFRIAAWDRPHDNTDWIAQYTFGWQEDAPKPAPLTRRQRGERQNAKRRFVNEVISSTPVSVFDLVRTTVTSQATV